MRTAKWLRSKKGHIRIFGLVAGVYMVFSLMALALIDALSANSGNAAASGLTSPAHVSYLADQAALAAIPLGVVMMGALLWILLDIRGLLVRQASEGHGRGKEGVVVKMRERHGGTRSYRRAS